MGVLAVAVGIGVYDRATPGDTHWVSRSIWSLALIFGVLLIVPIGGADMPTVIALLNSYAGLSACAMGFALDNKLLIIAGALTAASGFILSIIMCKAMNRSFTNVLFGGIRPGCRTSAAGKEARPVRSRDVPKKRPRFWAMRAGSIIVPGYGMAVAQAQHKIRELHDLLTKRGVDVQFAIHPVAGRMPGHMNVLLAEADVPYDKLIEMEDINPRIAEDRRGADRRRQRHRQSRGAERSDQPDLPECRFWTRTRRRHRHGHQAQHGRRLRRHR